jgi:hypothetical protein
MHTNTRKQLGKIDNFDKEKAIAMCNSKWQPTVIGQIGEVVDVFYSPWLSHRFLQINCFLHVHNLLTYYQSLMRATWECVRFEKRRAQEELEVVNMKITCLQSNREGGAVVDRLMEEIKSYKTLLKCSVCHERQKEVNHLSLSLSLA